MQLNLTMLCNEMDYTILDNFSQQKMNHTDVIFYKF